MTIKEFFFGFFLHIFLLTKLAKQEYITLDILFLNNSNNIDYYSQSYSVDFIPNKTFVFNKNLPVVPYLFYNDTQTYKTILATNIYQSLMLTTLIKNDSRFYPYEEECPHLSNKTLSLPQMTYQICSNKNNSIEVSFSQEDFEITESFIPVIGIILQNSETFFTSILSIDSLLRNNGTDFSAIYIDNLKKKLVFRVGNESDEEINFLPSQSPSESYNYSFSSCLSSSESPFTCSIEYLLIGNIWEEDDPFLAKNITSKEVVFLDSLSFYSVLPYYYLEYFMTSFFDEKSDECEEKTVDSKNMLLFYIKCSKQKIQIYTIYKTINFIINGYEYNLGNLFNDTFLLTKEYSSEHTYFNILFRKNNSDWILGNSFFINKSIGYDKAIKRTVIFSKQRKNFTDFTQNSYIDQKFKMMLYLLTFICLGIFLAYIGFHAWRNKKKINREIANLLRDKEE